MIKIFFYEIKFFYIMVRYFLIITLIFTNCSPQSNVSVYKLPTDLQKLKTDGCYYEVSMKTNKVFIYFLYNNGVFFHEGISFNNIDEGIQYYTQQIFQGDFVKRYGNGKPFWGTFRIINDGIILERPDAFHGYPILKFEGRILNDTTFIISSSTENGVPRKFNNSMTFHFKQFTNKPDSTNNFFK